MDQRLGFGCAHLPGKLSRPDAARLIETALDAGINHFDVARMYGDGLAEAIVGDVAHRRRAEMVIVTKAGITPAPRALPARALRRALDRVPALSALTPRPLREAVTPRFGQFAAAQVRASLERSLRELLSDHVDALLLHECEPAHISDELLRELERLQSEGKVRAIGIATSPTASAALVATHPDLCRIVQVDARAQLKPPPGAQLILHSALGGRLDAGLAPNQRTAAAQGLMRNALARDADVLLLFSSFSPVNIRANAAFGRSLATEKAFA